MSEDEDEKLTLTELIDFYGIDDNLLHYNRSEEEFTGVWYIFQAIFSLSSLGDVIIPRASKHVLCSWAVHLAHLQIVFENGNAKRNVLKGKKKI